MITVVRCVLKGTLLPDPAHVGPRGSNKATTTQGSVPRRGPGFFHRQLTGHIPSLLAEPLVMKQHLLYCTCTWCGAVNYGTLLFAPAVACTSSFKATAMHCTGKHSTPSTQRAANPLGASKRRLEQGLNYPEPKIWRSSKVRASIYNTVLLLK